MGGAASTQQAIETVVAYTTLIEQTMKRVFPDIYVIHDFAVQEQDVENMYSSNPSDSNLESLRKELGLEPIMNELFAGNSQQGGEGEASEGQGNEITAAAKRMQDECKLEVLVSGDVIRLRTVNDPNHDGWTPLHACCHSPECTDAAILLIDEIVRTEGAQGLNHKTIRGPGSFCGGSSPLHIASAYGLSTIVIHLCERGANANTTNSMQWTPLHDACHRGHLDVVRALVKAGADLERVCPPCILSPQHGQRPLAQACRQGHDEVAGFLLSSGADKDATNEEDWTALHEACFHTRVQTVQVLLVHGADAAIRTKSGLTCYALACDENVRGAIMELATEKAKAEITTHPFAPSGLFGSLETGIGGFNFTNDVEGSRDGVFRFQSGFNAGILDNEDMNAGALLSSSRNARLNNDETGGEAMISDKGKADGQASGNKPVDEDEGEQVRRESSGSGRRHTVAHVKMDNENGGKQSEEQAGTDGKEKSQFRLLGDLPTLSSTGRRCSAPFLVGGGSGGGGEPMNAAGQRMQQLAKDKALARKRRHRERKLERRKLREERKAREAELARQKRKQQQQAEQEAEAGRDRDANTQSIVAEHDSNAATADSANAASPMSRLLRRAPKEFRCTITDQLLREPVQSPYGQVFERAQLEAFLKKHGPRCPHTGAPLTVTDCTPATALQRKIDEWYLQQTDGDTEGEGDELATSGNFGLQEEDEEALYDF